MRLVFFLILISFQTFSQVLDDSTKQIYGPKTVSYILENDVLKNYKTDYQIDTTLHNFRKSDPILSKNWLFQDLGNVGTAAKPLFFEKTFDPSTQLGYGVFSLYSPKTSDFRYYNTKSPFTNLGYIQGFKGNIQLDFTHSQNINPRLNITLNVSKFNSSKQIDATNSEEKLVDHWSYNFTSNYFSKNKKYGLLTAFYHFNHAQNEQGGILQKESLSITPKDLKANYRRFYDSQFENGVYNRERWNNFHLYQQFVLRNGFQAFHVMDYEHQKHIFFDPNFSVNQIQPSYNLSKTDYNLDTLTMNFTNISISNKIGIKGRYHGFNYIAHIRNRNYSLVNKLSETFKTNIETETFLGGQIGYYFKDSSNFLNVDGEFSLDISKFYINATIFYKGIEGTFYQSLTPAGIFYNKFDNGILSWNKELQNVSNTYINAAYPLKFKKFNFKPMLSNLLIGNYVYLNEKMLPTQLNKEPINITNLELSVGYDSKRFNFSNQFILNLNNSSDIYKLPSVINNTNLEFKIRYAKVLDIFVGTDLYYKTKYTADAYSPLLNHFYLQNSFETWGTIVAEPYVMFHINKVRLALKFGHVNQGLPYQGFYVSPDYLAMPRAFLLKVDWPLFD